VATESSALRDCGETSPMARRRNALRDSGPEPRRRHGRFRRSLVREGRLDVDERSRAPDKFRSELAVLAAKWLSNNRCLINPAELLGNPGTTISRLSLAA